MEVSARLLPPPYLACALFLTMWLCSLTCALDSLLLLLPPPTKSRFLDQGCNPRSLLLDLLENLRQLRNRCHQNSWFSGSAQLQPTRKVFHFSLVTALSGLVLLLLILCFDTDCHSLRDLTGAALSVCISAFPLALPLAVPYLLKAAFFAHSN